LVDKKACMLYPLCFSTKKQKTKKMKKKFTNFNGSDSKSTSFEKQTDTTGSNTFAKTTNNSTSHQHVLHFLNCGVSFSFLFLTLFNEKPTKHWKNGFCFYTVCSRSSPSNTESVCCNENMQSEKRNRVWRKRRESSREW